MRRKLSYKFNSKNSLNKVQLELQQNSMPVQINETHSSNQKSGHHADPPSQKNVKILPLTYRKLLMWLHFIFAPTLPLRTMINSKAGMCNLPALLATIGKFQFLALLLLQ
jgi:hypothetical protein